MPISAIFFYFEDVEKPTLQKINHRETDLFF